MPAMNQIKYMSVDPGSISPNPWNTNVVSHENEAKLRASLERHGFFKPALVREVSSFSGARDIKLQAIGGWHRIEQAIELGWTEVPVVNLGRLDDDKAKEISLADNARYGIDDTLKLSELLGELDTAAIEAIMPWSHGDIAALTASLAIDIENLDLDEPILPDDEDPELPAAKVGKTHQLLRFRVSIADAGMIAGLINGAKLGQGFTTEDDLTNAGDALAYLLGKTDSEDDDVAA